MALSLKDKETDRLAREVAALTGETLTDAIRKALAPSLAFAAFDHKREFDPRHRRDEPNRRGFDGLAVTPLVRLIEQDRNDSRGVDYHQRHMPVSS